MNRRTFLGAMTGSLLAAPRATAAQQPGNVYRIGFLRNGPPPETFIEGLRTGLRELGVQLLFLAVRDAGDFERAFSEARGASALIQLDDVIFTSHRKRVVELAVRHQLAGGVPTRLTSPLSSRPSSSCWSTSRPPRRSASRSPNRSCSGRIR